MDESTTDLAELVTSQLALILSGRFTLSMDEVTTVADPVRAEILTGLLFLNQDLEFERAENVRLEAERDAANRELLGQAQQRVDLMMSNFTGLFWLIGSDLRVRSVESRSSTPDDAVEPATVGVHVTEFLSPDDPLLHAISAAISGQATTLDWRWRAHTFQCTITPYRWSHAEPTGAAVAAFDVTTQRLLEARGREASRLESLGQLAGGVAHDFNNLLTIIKNYAHLLEDTVAGDVTGAADLEQILEATDRAAELVQQLLAFGRRQFRSPEVVELDTVVTDFGQMVGRAMPEDIELALDLNSERCRVHVDRTQLEQVLMNLVMNARDAMPEGGVLTIETRALHLAAGRGSPEFGLAPGTYAVIMVSDTGIGMAPETLRRVFEPFFTTKGRGDGTGLGLATAHGIIKQTGGDITVYSEPGEGTTFKVYLPSTQLLVAKPDELGTAAASSAQPLSILFVEDDPAVRAVVERLLQSAGHAVASVSGPPEALATIRSWVAPPDLLLTDVVMPGMNGRQLAHILNQRWPELKVLYISGYSENVVVKQGVLLDDCHLLTKPFRPKDLYDLIAVVMAS